MSKFSVNCVIRGSNVSYRLLRPLAPHVFQATVEGTGSLVAIKLSPENAYLFKDEKNTYSWQSIISSPYIRSLREHIDDDRNRCLVFEWMDRTLWETKDESIECKKRVFKTVATSCLKGLLAFQKMDGENDYCHADSSLKAKSSNNYPHNEDRDVNMYLNPNNILISDFSSSLPVVKILDLGFTTRAGSDDKYDGRLQGSGIRAPDIWRGATPSPAMDVWSLGVSLVDWISARLVFGFGGCHVETNCGPKVTKNAWAIAKLHKVRKASLSDPVTKKFELDFIVAEAFLLNGLVKNAELREQLEEKQITAECIDFIEHLLTVDPKQRPSVVEALAHPYLQN